MSLKYLDISILYILHRYRYNHFLTIPTGNQHEHFANIVCPLYDDYKYTYLIFTMNQECVCNLAIIQI